MTSQDQNSSTLIDQTVQALKGNATAVSPTDGTSLIDSWIKTLGTDSPVTDSLNDLKEAIQGSGADIQDILADLADQTESAAAGADSSTQASLQSLASSLKSFGQQLS